mgnify:CR=1 FL=1
MGEAVWDEVGIVQVLRQYGALFNASIGVIFTVVVGRKELA